MKNHVDMCGNASLGRPQKWGPCCSTISYHKSFPYAASHRTHIKTKIKTLYISTGAVLTGSDIESQKLHNWDKLT